MYAGPCPGSTITKVYSPDAFTPDATTLGAEPVCHWLGVLGVTGLILMLDAGAVYVCPQDSYDPAEAVYVTVMAPASVLLSRLGSTAGTFCAIAAAATTWGRLSQCSPPTSGPMPVATMRAGV